MDLSIRRVPDAHRRTGARGHGAGEALVRACIARARAAEGVERLVQSTQSTMSGAHRICHRLGFVPPPEHDRDPIAGVALLTYNLSL
ncbi:GNAT family N-acetyltransferase [Streptomyces sp. NPDC051286]|uniref:GNAT family N-acetyltransferase n=1 Tax=Streptomyces sp. NPDC051286 TaxID=3365647 RepID=UPI0037AEDCD6